jgi:hypothetical protein
MNQNNYTRLGMVSLEIMLALLLTFTFTLRAHAHNGVDHATEAESAMHTAESLEPRVVILQQLVSLLTEYKKLYGAFPLPITTHADDSHDHDDSSPTLDTHEDELEDEDAHDETADSNDDSKLVIEVEEHMGRTHVHVRYTDKPEEMFFVDTPLSNEDGLVADIVSRTGLSADVVRPALTYL